MSLHTKREFAAICGMTTRELAVYIGPNRQKVILSGDLIDDTHPQNIDFIRRRKDLALQKGIVLNDRTNKSSNETIDDFETLDIYNECVESIDDMHYSVEAEKSLIELMIRYEVDDQPFKVIPTQILFYIIVEQTIDMYQMMLKREIDILGEISTKDKQAVRQRYTAQCKNKIESFKNDVNKMIDEIISTNQ